MNIAKKDNSGDLDIINSNTKTDLQTIESEGVFIFVVPCTMRSESQNLIGRARTRLIWLTTVVSGGFS